MFSTARAASLLIALSSQPQNLHFNRNISKFAEVFFLLTLLTVTRNKGQAKDTTMFAWKNCADEKFMRKILIVSLFAADDDKALRIH